MSERKASKNTSNWKNKDHSREGGAEGNVPGGGMESLVLDRHSRCLGGIQVEMSRGKSGVQQKEPSWRHTVVRQAVSPRCFM